MISPEINNKQTDQWYAYQDAWLEVPLWGYIFVKWPSSKCLKKLPGYFFGVRWLLLSPFRAQVRLGFLGLWSLGEIIMASVIICGSILIGVFNFQDTVLLGELTEIPVCLVYSLGTRNSIWTLLLGLPFERAIFWHQMLSFVVVALGITHAISAWDPSVDGLVFLCAMGTLVFMSFPPIRRRFWDFWLRVHWVLFIVAGVAGMIHGASGIAVGLGMWFADILVRYIFMACLKYPQKVEATSLPGNLVMIKFLKGDFQYKAGQYIFLCVPELSLFEWHPFSLSSSPHEAYVTCIRVLGDWTKRLHALVSESQSPNLNIRIEGPFGTPSVDLSSETYKCILLISGGIGVTPMRSICNDLMYQHKVKGRMLKKVWFVWTLRDLQMLTDVLHCNDEEKENQQADTCVFLTKNSEASESLDSASAASPEVLFADFYISPAPQNEIRQKNVKTGRPNFSEIFEKMAGVARATGESKVAVLVCGPMPMVNDISRISIQKSTAQVQFHAHSEVFQL